MLLCYSWEAKESDLRVKSSPEIGMYASICLYEVVGNRTQLSIRDESSLFETDCSLGEEEKIA